jgi:hypothetical protein
MVGLGRVVVDVSAVRDAGRSNANLAPRPARAHDCRSAAGRDFLWPKAEPVRLLASVLRAVLERRRARQPQAAPQKAACPPGRLVSSRQGQLAISEVLRGESGLLLTHRLLVRRVLQPAAQLWGQELAPWATRVSHSWPRALRVQSVLRPAQGELRAHSVSRQLARRWLAAVPRAQPASCARPSLLRPSLLFPL